MRDALAGVALACVIGAARLAPRGLIPLLARVLAGLARPFLGRDLRQQRANVEMAFGLRPGTYFAREFERQTLHHQAVCLLETLKGISDPGAVTVVGEAELAAEVARADAAGRGRVMVTAHLGSWELCAYFGRRAGAVPFHVLAKPPRFASARRRLAALRARMGVDVLWTDRKSLLRDMLQALKDKQAVGFVMDQKPEGRKGPVVPFFGQATEFVAGPATMAIRVGCPVVAIFCVREGPFRYRLVSRTVAEAGAAGTAGTDEVALTARLAATLEEVIRAYPEQWTWNYKRWKYPSTTASS